MKRIDLYGFDKTLEKYHDEHIMTTNDKAAIIMFNHFANEEVETAPRIALYEDGTPDELYKDYVINNPKEYSAREYHKWLFEEVEV